MRKSDRWLFRATLSALLCVSAVAVYLGIRLHYAEDPIVIRSKFETPIVMRTEGGLLEVTRVAATTTFERTDPSHFWGIDLGKTVSRIRVPVTFRYHIELAPEWRATVREGQLFVVAPPMKASLPVAIDTSKLEQETKAGWARFNARENLEDLQRSISSELAKNAVLPANVEVQREDARKTVREFVVKWLLAQERWKDISPAQVRVFFADERVDKLGASVPTIAKSL